MRVRLFASVAALFFTAAMAFAQSDRRDRQFPELVVESGGRLGSCDSLQFTADGKYVLAIGDDKVVRIWPYRNGQLQTAGMDVLRWTSWHEQRGAIFALALSPDKGNQHVAIAGIGQPSTSTVVVLDRATKKVLHQTVAVPPRGENSNAIWSIAYAPDGKHIAFGDSYGGVWLWDLTGAAVRLTDRALDPEKVNIVRFVHFFDDNTLVAVAEDGTGKMWDPSKKPAKSVALKDFETGGRLIFRVALSPDEKWYAAATTKNPAAPTENLIVVLRSVAGTESHTIELNKHEFARAVAFDAKSEQLAVTIGHKLADTDFAMEGEDRIDFYDLKTRKATAGPRDLYRAWFMAFHPNGKDVAIAAGENHEVTLWNIGHWDHPVNVMAGAGRSLWGVAVSADGNEIAFRNARNPQSLDPNDRGQGSWRVFNLLKRKWTDPADFKPVKQLSAWNGWTVKPNKGDAYVWYAVTPNNDYLTLPLDKRRDGMPLCYTFLPPNDKQPLRLAVGHLWGVSIYELTGTTAKRVRLCTGHQADVTALAATADGTYLVTASTDQTIDGWNLENNWPSQPTLGASFEIKEDKLYVKKVDVGSPAWEAGLVPGDEVVSFHFKGDPKPLAGGPEAWQKQLENPEPGVEHGFRLKRDGKALTPLATSVRQRPLWRFFPTPAGEWVLWMWQGSYYDTSTKGDSYIGWHVNAPDFTHEPAFYRAEQFRAVYERADVLDTLLKTHDVAAALAEAAEGNPLPPRFNEKEPPLAALQLATATTKTDDVKATLTATPHGTNPDYQPVRAELWLNDFRLIEDKHPDRWDRVGQAFHKTLTIPNNMLRAGDNVVTFQIYNRAGGRTEVVTSLHCTRPAAAPRLWGLSVGVNDYRSITTGPGGRGKLGNLVVARSDAEAIQKSWQAQTTLYKGTDMFLELDDQAKRADLIKALDELAKNVKPEDRCIIFLAGHGIFVEHKATKERPPTTTWLFCCPDFDATRPEQTGITSEVLYEKLAAIPGRKLVILDACHSGEAVANPVRGLVPGGQGPIIMASCDRSQSAFEDQKKLKHGLFTYAILEALGDDFQTASGGKKELDARELYIYTKQRLPGLLKDIHVSESGQVPTLFEPPGPSFSVAARMK